MYCIFTKNFYYFTLSPVSAFFPASLFLSSILCTPLHPSLSLFCNIHTSRNIRKSQPADKTILIRVNRTDLSSFDDLEDVRKLFADPEYPKFEPQTVNPEWSCAVNAKYDILQMVLDQGHVKTDTLAWLDIGLFKYGEIFSVM